MPAETLARLRRTLDQALTGVGLEQRLSRAGFDPVPARTPAQLEAFMATQVAFRRELVNRSGATMDWRWLPPCGATRAGTAEPGTHRSFPGPC